MQGVYFFNASTSKVDSSKIIEMYLRTFKTNFFKEAISLILIWRYLFDIKSDKWQKNNKLSLLSKKICYN